MARRALSLSKVYGLLEPGPVVLLTTAHDGHRDIMALSWHTMMEFEPPLVGCIVSHRNHSFDLLMTTRECVLNLPSVDLAEQVVGCGNTSGRRMDKFARFGLTAKPASRVGAPLIVECFANLECRVVDTRLVSKYCFFILEVVAAWRDATLPSHTIHHLGRGEFEVSGEHLKLKSKMK